METKRDLSQLLMISRWELDDALLIEGARRGLTPNGECRAQVFPIAHDESAEICSLVLGQENELPAAYFIGNQPMLLRQRGSVSVPDGKGSEVAAVYGEFVFREPTIVIYMDFRLPEPQPCYVVCHPEFPAKYPGGFSQKELRKQLNSSPNVRSSPRPQR